MGKFKQFFLRRRTLGAGSHEFTSVYIKQVGATTIVKGLSVLISIVYVPLVLGFLDQEKYGIWVTLSTIVNWVRLLDIGMGAGMRNKLAEAIALKNNEMGRIYVSTTYFILGSIFLIFLIVFNMINPLLNWQTILNTEVLSQREFLRLTNVTVTFIVLGFIFQPITLIYAAHGDIATGGILQLFISALILLLIWLASLFVDKGNIVLLAWIISGVPVGVYILFSIFTFYKKYSSLRPSKTFVKIKESGNLMRLSGQFFIVQITATVIFASIPFVITQLFSPRDVATFNIATSIFNVPIMLMAIIAAPSHSLLTQSYAKNDFVWMKRMLKNQILISVLLSLGTVIMIIASPLIYKVWLGDKINIPFNLSLFIGIYTIIQILNAPFSAFINAIGKIRILVILGPIGIILFMVLSFLLSNLLKDVIGVSIALSITSLPMLFILPFVLRKALNLKYKKCHKTTLT